MNRYQHPFQTGLLDPAIGAPELLTGPDGAPAGRRYDVYRNNVTASLVDAMATGFPLVHKLLGKQSFDQLAPVFVRAHPPQSPLMMHYGAEFPDFLETFQPLASLGYLADAARFDLAMRRSYHARNSVPFDPETLQASPEEAVLELAAATQIVRSRWPLHDIWRFNFEDGAPQPGASAQDVLITRPGFDPVPYALPEGGSWWLEHLNAGLPLGAAHEATMAQYPDFDLTKALTLVLSAQAFSADAQRNT